jgi:hypothetical protein
VPTMRLLSHEPASPRTKPASRRRSTTLALAALLSSSLLSVTSAQSVSVPFDSFSLQLPLTFRCSVADGTLNRGDRDSEQIRDAADACLTTYAVSDCNLTPILVQLGATRCAGEGLVQIAGGYFIFGSGSTVTEDQVETCVRSAMESPVCLSSIQERYNYIDDVTFSLDTPTPIGVPTASPLAAPSQAPVLTPSIAPTVVATAQPSSAPVLATSVAPTLTPTGQASASPSIQVTASPSVSQGETPPPSQGETPPSSSETATTGAPVSGTATGGPTAAPNSSGTNGPTSDGVVGLEREPVAADDSASNGVIVGSVLGATLIALILALLLYRKKEDRKWKDQTANDDSLDHDDIMTRKPKSLSDKDSLSPKPRSAGVAAAAAPVGLFGRLFGTKATGCGEDEEDLEVASGGGMLLNISMAESSSTAGSGVEAYLYPPASVESFEQDRRAQSYIQKDMIGSNEDVPMSRKLNGSPPRRLFGLTYASRLNDEGIPDREETSEDDEEEEAAKMFEPKGSLYHEDLSVSTTSDSDAFTPAGRVNDGASLLDMGEKKRKYNLEQVQLAEAQERKSSPRNGTPPFF